MLLKEWLSNCAQKKKAINTPNCVCVCARVCCVHVCVFVRMCVLCVRVCVHVSIYNYIVFLVKCKYIHRQLSNARIIVGSIHIHIHNYDNSGHGSDNGKVKNVADNKMLQQMASHGVVCCLHRCHIVIRLWYIRQPNNMPQA